MKIILVLSLFLSATLSSAQTTPVLKPNAVIGEDATLWMLDDDCVPWSMSSTPADVNYGSSIELRYQDWTWAAAGCGSGTIRSLIRFSEVAAIPSSATVISAELRLYGPSEFPYDPITNSVYPGSPF